MDNPIDHHMRRLLQTREPPKTFCPSEVARALSPAELETEHASHWRELMPRIRKLAWEKRQAGKLEVLQKGEVLTEVVEPEDVTGPIRLRRTE